jgi:hypothetical protein
MLPPGLIAPTDRTRAVVQVERSAPVATSADPRWTVWSIAFVVLVALTVLALGLTVVDLLNG